MIILENQLIMAILNKAKINGRFSWLNLMMTKLNQNNLVSMLSWFMKGLLIKFMKGLLEDGISMKPLNQMETGNGKVRERKDYERTLKTCKNY